VGRRPAAAGQPQRPMATRDAIKSIGNGSRGLRAAAAQGKRLPCVAGQKPRDRGFCGARTTGTLPMWSVMVLMALGCRFTTAPNLVGFGSRVYHLRLGYGGQGLIGIHAQLGEGAHPLLDCAVRKHVRGHQGCPRTAGSTSWKPSAPSQSPSAGPQLACRRPPARRRVAALVSRSSTPEAVGRSEKSCRAARR